MIYLYVDSDTLNLFNECFLSFLNLLSLLLSLFFSGYLLSFLSLFSSCFLNFPGLLFDDFFLNLLSLLNSLGLSFNFLKRYLLL